jgi:branched-chain amino acid transport system ATP-binding protein
LKPTAGSVCFDGTDVTKWRTFLYPRLGIVLAPEGRSVFATLTVAENLELTFRRSKGRAGVKPALDKAYAMFPRLGERRNQIAGTLSGGEQRMLSLSRVMVEQPRVLIADELSLGLAPIIVDEVYGVLATIRDAGTTLLIIEQHVHHALNIADDAIVLVKGEVAYSGPVSELGDLQARVLGETPDD